MKEIKQVKGRKALQDLANEYAKEGKIVSDYEKAYATGKTRKPFEKLTWPEIDYIYRLAETGKLPTVWGVIQEEG